MEPCDCVMMNGRFNCGGKYVFYHTCGRENMKKQITDEERSMLNYFFIDKGDVTRWAGWEEFAKNHPEVKLANDKMESAVNAAYKEFREVLENL